VTSTVGSSSASDSAPAGTALTRSIDAIAASGIAARQRTPIVTRSTPSITATGYSRIAWASAISHSIA